MSELKAFVARKIDDGSCDPVPCIEVYPKSEADKFIADLEESYKKEVGQLLMEIAELKAQKQQAKTPIVVNVGPEKLKEYEELFTKISSIDEMKMPFHDTSKNLAQEIERRMFEVMTNNRVTEVFVVDGCINYDGEVARFDSVIVLNEEAARDLAKQHNTVYNHLDFTNVANMSDEEFDRIVAEAEKNGNSNTDVVRKWRETVRETTETLHIKEDE